MGVVKYTGPMASFHCPTNANINSLKVYFSPKQLGEGDPSPENVREISGWNGIEVTQTKGNLIQRIYSPSSKAIISNLTSAPDYKFTMTSNVESYVANNPGSYRNGYIDIAIDQTNLSDQIHIRAKVKQLTNPLNVDYIRISPQGKDANASNIPIINGIIDSTFKYVSDNNHFLELKNCGATLEISELILTVPNTDNIISLDWSPSIGTIYGGYVDLITGKLIQTMKQYIFDGSDDEGWSSAGGKFLNRYRYNTTSSSSGVTPDADFGDNKTSITACNYLYVAPNGTSADYSAYSDDIITGAVYHPQFFVAVKNQTTINEWKTYLSDHPLIVVAYLQAPITYQLTPQQLQTFLGKNNIWSNADYIEIEYDLHETQNILAHKNFIIANQPHIIGLSTATVQNFTTDISAPLKECKIYFNPIQAGSGDPSPDNIRPISGWTEINLYKTKKNMFLVSSENRREWNAASTDYTEIEGGIHTSATKTCMPAYVMKCKPNMQYTCSFKANKSNGSLIARIWSLKTEYQPISQNYVFLINKADPGTQYSGTFTTQEDTEYVAFGFYQGNNIRDVTITEMQIESGAVGTEYEPYNGTTIPITFPSKAGTVYGGYVDLINGELIQTHDIHTFTPSRRLETAKTSETGKYRYIDDTEITNAAPNPSSTEYSGLICNRFPDQPATGVAGINGTAQCFDGVAIRPQKNFYLYYESLATATLAEAQTWCSENPVEIVYPLATPIHYQIDPIILKTLRGVNNIWANSNGKVEIKYWTY